MPLKTMRDPQADLTIHTVIGPAEQEEMYAALMAGGPENQTRLVLWDMSGAEVGHVTAEILRPFIMKAAELGQAREGGRTAVVAPDDLAYGLAHMSEALTELAESPYRLRAFRSQAEALVWLQSEDPGD